MNKIFFIYLKFSDAEVQDVSTCFSQPVISGDTVKLKFLLMMLIAKYFHLLAYNSLVLKLTLSIGCDYSYTCNTVYINMNVINVCDRYQSGPFTESVNNFVADLLDACSCWSVWRSVRFMVHFLFPQQKQNIPKDYKITVQYLPKEVVSYVHVFGFFWVFFANMNAH